MAQDVTYHTVTISSGTAVSGALRLGERTLVGVYFPAAWDAANLTFQSGPQVAGSEDSADVTWHDVYDQGGSEVVLTEPAGGFDGNYVAIEDPSQFEGTEWLRVRSGTTSTPVNQTADRVLTLALAC